MSAGCRAPDQAATRRSRLEGAVVGSSLRQGPELDHQLRPPSFAGFANREPARCRTDSLDGAGVGSTNFSFRGDSTHKNRSCRSSAGCPIIPLSALLSLVKWLENRRSCSQGGRACNDPRKGGGPATGSELPDGATNSALASDSGEHPPTDAPDASTHCATNRVASRGKGGDA